MNDDEYTLAQDMTRCRIAKDVLDQIISPSLPVQQVRNAHAKIIDRGYRALERVMQDET